MDTFHGDDGFHCFESDDDNLEYLTSLMSDDEIDAKENASLQPSGADVVKPKSRAESGVFDEELNAVAKSRKRRHLHDTSKNKKRLKEPSPAPNNDHTALLEAELKAMKEKMLKVEQLLQEKKSQKPVTKVVSDGCTTSRTHSSGMRVAHKPQNKNVDKVSQNAGKASLGGTSVTETYHRHHQKENARKILDDEKAAEKACITDVYSGLRIRSPLVSSQTMKERMANRKMIRIPVVCSRVKDCDIAGDWVTIGVVVSKLPPKDTATGGRFCTLRISDLSSQSAVLLVFLFGDACKVHWKLLPGEAVAILNASLRPDDRAGPGKYTLSLTNPDKLMRMGISHDFTQCKATVKATGKKCTNFAKKSEGGCCEYHIGQEYRSKVASRMELQSGYGPSIDGLRRVKQQMAKDNVFYGGDVAQTSKEPKSVQKKKVNRLFTPGASETAAHMSRELKVQEKVSSQLTAEESAVFKEMLQLQTVGARNFNQYRNKEIPVPSDEKKNVVLSANEVIREQSGNSHLLTTPSVAPYLGRGSLPGTEIDLSTTKKSSSLAKFKAIALVEQNPIEKEDPNAIRKQKASVKTKELLAERVKGSRKQKENVGQDDATRIDTSNGSKKKMSMDEIERIMNKKSTHEWEVKEDEQIKEEVYFQQLEKKEAMEEKMQKIDKLLVKVVSCKECGYTAEHASDWCRKDGHHLTHKRTEKRFFTCSSCDTHTVAYDRYPSKPCTKCGSTSFKRAGMFKGRTGPKLDSEKLLLRGEEEKFLK